MIREAIHQVLILAVLSWLIWACWLACKEHGRNDDDQ